ncbi:MAG: cell division protein ZapA [Devosia sp.]
MPDVNVEVDGKKYRMACEEGEEEHLLGLASRLDAKVAKLRASLGEVGDSRLLVMAGLAAMDELAEAERNIETLKAGVTELTSAGRDLTIEAEAMERGFSQRLAEAARRVESIASAIDEAGAPATT